MSIESSQKRLDIWSRTISPPKKEKQPYSWSQGGKEVFQLEAFKSEVWVHWLKRVDLYKVCIRNHCGEKNKSHMI